jgi:membrane-associated protein
VVLAIASSRLDSHWGYVLLFAIIAAEASGVPLPGETALIAAGVLAGIGHLEIEIVIAVAAVAAILGDSIGFLIGRHVGRTLLERPGPFEPHRKALIDRGEPFFERHGPKAVFLARWMPGLRVVSAWMAGVNRMPWPSFAVWNGLGGVAWAVSIGMLAYWLGPVVEQIVKDFGIASIAVAVVLVTGYLVVRHARSDG